MAAAIRRYVWQEALFCNRFAEMTTSALLRIGERVSLYANIPFKLHR